MTGILALIIQVHGYWRWVLLLVAVVVAIKFLIGWLRHQKMQATDLTLGSLFAGFMTLQFVLGLIILIGYISTGAFNPRIHIEYALYGLIAVGISHALPLSKADRPDVVRFRTSFFMVLVSLLIIGLSVIRLRGGWVWSP